jgi:energy-coupling factor transporter ATP-binding protein EcfA2
VLVLDEPTSALDPPAAEDVLAALTRLVHDLGITVVAAEHRLERVIHYADRVLQVSDE